MNGPTELDSELLEAYLDDALSAAQVEQVAQRLLCEPELAAAMHEMRAQRALRNAAWRSLEPADGDISRLISRMNRVVRREQLGRALQLARHVGFAAAAAILVFVAGWLLHSSEQQAPGGAGISPTNAPVFTTARGPADSPAFRVLLIDDTGHEIPIQRFSRADEARRFTQGLIEYESRRRQAQQGSAMLVSDRF